MTTPTDPTEAMRKKAAALAGASEGQSCNQSSFKVAQASFFFVGPGAKGQGFKAMFKLKDSIVQAQQLAARDPDRVQTGSTAWGTARFTAEEPMAKALWEKWLKESYAISRTSGAKKKPAKKA